MFMQASGGGALDRTAQVCVLAEQSGVLHAADSCLARYAAIIHFKTSFSFTAGTAVLNNLCLSVCLSACFCLCITVVCQQLLAACLCCGASHVEWLLLGQNVTMNLHCTCQWICCEATRAWVTYTRADTSSWGRALALAGIKLPATRSMCHIPFTPSVCDLASLSQLQATLQLLLLQAARVLPGTAEAKRSSSEAKPWHVTAVQMQADFLAGRNMT